MFIAVFTFIGLQFEACHAALKRRLVELQIIGFDCFSCALLRFYGALKRAQLAALAVLSPTQEIAAKGVHHLLRLVTLACQFLALLIGVAGPRIRFIQDRANCRR
ncbi:hypothetical protein OK016_15300 [Vibrio chagasii]|nr:hypothetical protein [Vibrio chagasii]